MVWILLTCVIMFLALHGWKLKHASGHASPASMKLPDPRAHRASMTHRASVVSTQLQKLGLIHTHTDDYAFALPHTHIPLSLQVSSTTTNSTLKISGSLRGDAAIKGLVIVSGYHTGIQIKGEDRTRALFDRSGLQAQLFEQTTMHKTIQCNLNRVGELTLTLQLTQDASLEETCTWLMHMQDELSRQDADWLKELLRRTHHAPSPELAAGAMAYIIDWHPEHIAALIQDAPLLNDWAHVALLTHLHGPPHHTTMSTESVTYVERLIAQEHTPPTLRVRAMNVCVHTLHTPYERAIFSSIALALLAQGEQLSDDMIDLLTRLSHDEIAKYYVQSDDVMKALSTLLPDRASQVIEAWLSASWSHVEERHMLLDYAQDHGMAHTEIGMLGVGVLFWDDLTLCAGLTQKYFGQPLLSDVQYMIWERLIQHRASEFATDFEFLKVLAAHVAAKRQRHGQICRLLILELGDSSHMPELLARLLPTTRPETQDGWMRCAALVSEHMIEREDMLDIMLDLLSQCPSEDTARRLAALLPVHNPKVQDFLIGWPLTPHSVRHGLLSDHDVDELDVSRARALIQLLSHKRVASMYATKTLAILRQRGPVHTVKWLHELRRQAHTRAFHKDLDATLEHLSTRFAAQGGELSLSDTSGTQGALTLDTRSTS